MVVCSFFMRGTCRYGTSCKFEHPADAQRQPSFGNSTWKNPANNTDSKPILPYTSETMKTDLTQGADRPIWPLTCYGPAKYEPTLLSELDESPEELRFKAFTATKAGNIQEYAAYETNKITAAGQVFANAYANISQAYEQAAAVSRAAQTPSAPPAANNTQTSAFGTSSFGGSSTASAFSKPGFGQPSFGQSSFGSTPATGSVFGPSSTTSSPFGKPQNPTSVFGQTQTTTSAFGSAGSTFGQPAGTATSTFGQPTTSAFGQPSTSAFGTPQNTAPTSAFGQPSQPQSSLIKPASGAFGSLNSTTTNAFGGGGFSAFAGQPSAFGTTPATNTNTTPTAFSASSAAPQTGGSVFGQSGFGQSAPATSVSTFGQPTSNTSFSTFGTPAATSFGAPSAFGNLAQQNTTAPTSAFGTSAFPTTSGAFGGAATSGPFGSGGSVFGRSSQAAAPASAFPSQSATSSSFSSNTSKTAAVKPKAGPPDFESIRGTYKPGSTPYDQQLPPNYIELVPATALAAFKERKFEWGNVPDWIPPLELR